MSSDEPSKAELKERVDQLEATVQKMLPSRRQALKGIGAAGTGAVLGGLLTGGAAGQQFGSAQGQVGTDSTPVSEVVAADVTAQTVSTESAELGDNDIWFAGNESQLASIKPELFPGDVLVLGAADFTTDRTFSERLKVVGTGSFTNGTRIQADWTFDDRITIRDIEFLDAGQRVTLNGQGSSVIGGGGGSSSEWFVNADDCIVTHLNSCSVTFASGTSGGLVDSCTGTTVTDNGTNTTGDIA